MLSIVAVSLHNGALSLTGGGPRSPRSPRSPLGSPRTLDELLCLDSL